MRYILPLAALIATPAAAQERPDPARLKASVERLVSFGTRHTLSSPDNPTRGIGAARRWFAGELNKLGEPIGKQDQYIAAIGGITAFTFHPDGRVEYRPCKITEETLFNLEDNLLLFFTGYSRSASGILKDQNDTSKANDKAMLDNLHFTKELGYKSLDCLETGNLEEFARLMDIHWQRKKARSSGMSNQHINEWYDHAMAHGALGGKLIGAGGGGFLMFYAADKKKLRHAMREKGLQEVRFRFDFEGTKVVIQ